MLKTTASVLGLCALVILYCACASKAGTATTNPPLAGAQKSAVTGELKYKAPDGWVTEQTTSSMRAAQYKLPKVEGDSEDAGLVLYFFGQGQSGSVSDNVDRWINQMVQPDGKPSKEKAKTETLTVNGLKVTMVEVAGTYTAQMSPGSEARHNNSNYRLLAAVVETPKGNYFAKLIGPDKTVSHWSQAFNDYVKSFEFK